jgi:hypothetical protein
MTREERVLRAGISWWENFIVCVVSLAVGSTLVLGVIKWIEILVFMLRKVVL